MKYIIAAVFTCVVGMSLAQSTSTFGISFGAGGSIIDRDTQSWDVNWAPSVAIGAFFDYVIADKWFIGAELGVNQIEGSERLIRRGLGSNLGIDVSKHFTYVSIPLLCKYKTEKFSVALGARTSKLVLSSSDHVADFGYGRVETKKYSGAEDLNVETWDLGIQSSFGVSINEHWSISLGYFYSLVNLTVSDIGSPEQTVQQILLGLRFDVH